MKCPTCNSKLHKKFSFCPHCGNKFSLENINSPSSSEKVEESNPVESNENLIFNDENNSVDVENSVFEKNEDNEVFAEGLVKDEFIEKQKTYRRKSLFYLFSVSIIFLFFTFCSVVLMEHLNNLNKKIDDLSNFHYSNHNELNSDSVLNNHISDGTLSFDTEKVTTNGDKLLVEFNLKKFGDLKYKNKELKNLSKSDLHRFSYPILEELWFDHISNIHFEKYDNVTIKLFIDGNPFSYIEK